jgi:hypothetical protein
VPSFFTPYRCAEINTARRITWEASTWGNGTPACGRTIKVTVAQTWQAPAGEEGREDAPSADAVAEEGREDAPSADAVAEKRTTTWTHSSLCLSESQQLSDLPGSV